MPYILALDEGTTSARTIVFDEQAREVARASAPIDSHYPHEGWVEQDAEAIWQAQKQTLVDAVAKAGIAASDVAGIGITNQRETTIVWDRKTGQPIAPAIVWQCRRTADRCRELEAAGHGEEITAKTGLLLDAYFSATKVRWILESVPGAVERAEAGELAFGTVDSWLVYKLTGGRERIVDETNASRTLLFNIHTGEWDDGLLKIFGVPRAMLPSVVRSSGVVAQTDVPELGASLPIGGMAGDQQAASYGQACFAAGLCKNTYGTGCFLLMQTGGAAVRSQNKLLATVAAGGASRQYAVEGSVFVAGAVVQWLRDTLQILPEAAASQALAQSIDTTGGVYFVPAFVGLGAPYWDPDARGAISGLTRGSGRAEIVRAALESIAYQTADVTAAMQADSGKPLAELRVDGGAAANNFLMQFQADVLNVPVVRPAYTETTALGAAFLAGLATNVWSGEAELASFWKADRRFEPAISEDQRQQLLAGWKAAVARSRG